MPGSGTIIGTEPVVYDTSIESEPQPIVEPAEDVMVFPTEDPSTSYEEADSYSADQTGYDYAAGGQSTTEPGSIG